jgi:hypothetical protein
VQTGERTLGSEALKVGDLARRTRLTIAAGEVSAEVFLQTIETMTMIENYYTPEQIESFRKRSAEAVAAGVDLAPQGTAAWQELLARLKEEMDNGTGPADPKVQALEKRRQALVSALSGGDKGIEENLRRLWTEQGDKLCAQFGIDPNLMAYLGKAAEAARYARPPHAVVRPSSVVSVQPRP